MGGLARRASYIKSVRAREPDVLLLDAGGVFGGYDEESRRRAETLIEGMNLMGYNALNLGDKEFLFGRSFLEEQRGKASFPFLSANLVSRGSQEPLGQVYVIKEVDHLKVGIIGLVSPVVWSNENEDLEVLDPSAVLNTLLPLLEEKTHVIILLACMSYTEAVELLETAEGVDLIIVSHEGRLTRDPIKENETIIVSGGQRGRHIGQLRIVADTAGQIIEFQSTAVKLNKQVGEEPTMLKLIDRHGFY